MEDTDGELAKGVNEIQTQLSQSETPFWNSRATPSIISNHGGRILCDSQVGRGTTFTIELPTGRDACGEPPVKST